MIVASSGRHPAGTGHDHVTHARSPRPQSCAAPETGTVAAAPFPQFTSAPRASAPRPRPAPPTTWMPHSCR